MKKLILILALLVTMFASCDDGRIYEKTVVVPEEGFTLKLTGNISGISNWPDKYSVVIAGFGENSEYAIISKIIPAPSVDGGSVQVTLSGIGDDVTTLELCVLNRLRKRIVSYKTLNDLTADADTIYMDASTVDVGMYSTIQNKVFNENCVGCHGRSNFAAKNLFLTDGKSYDALVNRASNVDTEKLLVSPGSAQESFLHFVLNRNGDTQHDHADILSTKTSLLTLIDDWIDGGAKQ
ncbi:hypothetical protein [Bacteroides helcogenes]|uniref:Cytochrome c domain-containing protein n=1 Tax=Bacteroides helcogenes (strain ATCC 35417 / DSM 20613 / JCM 6297 / CCUG 15421 / P 36-108) TaxID=693979 RepID=E6SUL1_BACT6|nr:hypothetical protein [Bacteroides helcogenes]ADV43375.1 hypothetical protein Bache_1369 [Bacteroides helcogenes P 36-108]